MKPRIKVAHHLMHSQKQDNLATSVTRRRSRTRAFGYFYRVTGVSIPVNLNNRIHYEWYTIEHTGKLTTVNSALVLTTARVRIEHDS